MKSNTKKKGAPKKNVAVLPLPTKALGEALDKAKAKLVAETPAPLPPKPDFAKTVQVDKLDQKTLDVVADLLSDDAAKRERARASAKALVPADHKRKAPETVTTQIQQAVAKGKTRTAGNLLRKQQSEPTPANTGLAVHINKTGRVCFGKIAAQRLEGYGYMVITIEGKTVTFVPHSKNREGAVEIRDASGRPYVSATKLLKQVGFDGTKPLDLIATPVGDVGLQVKVG